MDNQFSDTQTSSTPTDISASPTEVPPTPNVAHSKPTLSQFLIARLQQLGVSLLILAVVWVVALTILYLVGLRDRDALGFATVITLIASFFLRTVIPGLSAKTQPEPHTLQQPTDSAREIVETVVFVVVLVLLLKSFAAEAFVIPTGSMAETLWGYQKEVPCPECGLVFPVNCSNEVDPTEGPPYHINSCVCPNCRLPITLFPPGKTPDTNPGSIPDPGWHSGDRVLVAKFVYDLLDRLPNRLDVVVFKYPGDSTFPTSGPIKKHVPINYIKRLIGLPGETIGIHRGKLFVLSAEKAAEKGLVYNDASLAANDPGKKALLWKLDNTHHNDAVKLFEKGDFEIIRKKPENLLSMRRIVYDNDHQAKDLTSPEYQRWRPAEKSAWSANGKTAFSHEGTGNEKAFEWLTYKHILRGSPGKPQLITDFMGYNTATERGGTHYHTRNHPGNWASDLMTECQVDVADPKGTFALQLSRGPMRYQALFDLEKGTCSLYQIDSGNDNVAPGDFAPDAKPVTKELKSVSTAMNKKGTYRVRFANVDDRLTVWVDDRLVFDDGVVVETPRTLLPTIENDLERPVSIGSRNAKVSVSKIKVFRDTYYTIGVGNNDIDKDSSSFRPDDPKTWPDLAGVKPSTYYVQPGHFLCMGDNSPQSSDGRSWGLVPKRLLLGRALLVYYPFSRAGRIR